MGASSLGNERRRRQLGEHIQVVKVEIFGNRIIFVGKCGERMNLDFNEWKALKKEVKKRKAEAETKYKDDFARHINQSPIFPRSKQDVCDPPPSAVKCPSG